MISTNLTFLLMSNFIIYWWKLLSFTLIRCFIWIKSTTLIYLIRLKIWVRLLLYRALFYVHNVCKIFLLLKLGLIFIALTFVLLLLLNDILLRLLLLSFIIVLFFGLLIAFLVLILLVSFTLLLIIDILIIL